MDMEILASSMLRAHGFAVGPEVLTVREDQVVRLDFHPPNALLYAEFDLENGFAYNHNFYVSPKYRHGGIGTRLLAANDDICREAGLTVLINNNRNPKLWKRQGYRRLDPFWRMILARRLAITFKRQSVYKKN
jgi:GNAT superfamily N-acetyltransferase